MRFDDIETPRILSDGSYYSHHVYKDNGYGSLLCPSCEHSSCSSAHVRLVRVHVGWDMTKPWATKLMGMKPVHVCDACARSIDEENTDEDLEVARREAEVRLDEMALEHRMNQNWDADPRGAK